MSFDKRTIKRKCIKLNDEFLSIFQISCNFPPPLRPAQCSLHFSPPNPSTHSMGEEKKKKERKLLLSTYALVFLHPQRFHAPIHFSLSSPRFSLPLVRLSMWTKRTTLVWVNKRGKMPGNERLSIDFFSILRPHWRKKEIKTWKKKKNIGKLPRQRTWSAIIAMRWSSHSMHGLCPFMLFAWSLFFLHLVFPCFSLFFREIFFFKILSAKNKSPKLCKLNMRLCGFGIKSFSVCASSFECVDATLCVLVRETNF